MSHRAECSFTNRRLPQGLAGCDEHQIYDPTRYIGLAQESRSRRPYTSVNKEQFKKLAAQKKTPAQIAEIMGMNPSYPTIYAGKHKIKLQYKYRPRGKKVKVDKVKELAEQRRTRKEIADVLKCSTSAITKIAKKHDIFIERQRKHNSA
jgi:DNA-binding CsgD family transcriptional regulator